MPEPKILPTTFNDELIVVELLIVVNPDTFNDDLHVVMFFNAVFPEIFKAEINVEGSLKLRFSVAGAATPATQSVQDHPYYLGAGPAELNHVPLGEHNQDSDHNSCLTVIFFYNTLDLLYSVYCLKALSLKILSD